MTKRKPFWAVVLPGGKKLHCFRPHPLAPEYLFAPCGMLASDKMIALPVTEDGSGHCKKCDKALHHTRRGE